MYLTIDQKIFLDSHNIFEGEVFDAAGMKREEYKTKMKAGGYKVAIGVTPCAKGGHAMRNRHGTCLMCDPASLAFQARYKKTMYLYIAQPNTGSITKIGITDNLEDRARQLNLHKLGGFITWDIKFNVECPNAGRIEVHISNLLSGFNVPTPYLSKSGEICEEVYTCSLQQAQQAISEALAATNSRKKIKK